MDREYNAKINITELAQPIVNTFYDDFEYHLRCDDEELDNLLTVFPELYEKIKDEAMRIITVDYCKKKVAEKQSKKGA
jgi:hypothetical protein